MGVADTRYILLNGRDEGHRKQQKANKGLTRGGRFLFLQRQSFQRPKKENMGHKKRGLRILELPPTGQPTNPTGYLSHRRHRPTATWIAYAERPISLRAPANFATETCLVLAFWSIAALARSEKSRWLAPASLREDDHIQRVIRV